MAILKEQARYQLPDLLEEMFVNNCYFGSGTDLYFFRYVFATFEQNGQLPKDQFELYKLGVGLLKFYNSMTSRLEDDYYQPYNIEIDHTIFPLETTISYFYDVNDEYLDETYKNMRYEKETGKYIISSSDFDEDIELVYGEDLDELVDRGFEFNYGSFIEFCYEDSNVATLLSKNFTETEIYILLMVLLYNFEDCDADIYDGLTFIDTYSDYLTAIDDKKICSELVNSDDYIGEYGHVFAEIQDLI